MLAAAVLLQGCATPAPAPVSERVPPAKGSQVTVAKPGTPKPGPLPAVKPDAAVVVKPLAPAGPTYTVRQGDTLFSIAKSNTIPLRDLAAWNNIEDPTSIRVGQQLRLTPPDGVAIAAPGPAPAEVVETRPIDIAPPVVGTNVKTQPLGQRVPYSDQAYAQLSKSALPAKPDATPDGKTEVRRGDSDVEWSWPTEGKVTASFNESASKGIVISGKRGQPIVASAGGRVIFSGTGIRGLGKLVVIRHNSNYLSVYAHNDVLLVKEGQTVTRGQRIAQMGNSDADQVKLHFEIRRQGKPVDPTKFLPEM